MGEELLGAASVGVWTTKQAYAAGLSRHDIAARIATGEWQRLHRSVFSTGGVVPSADQRAWAAVLAAGGVAGGRTAARAHELPLIDDDGREDVVTHGRSRPGVLAHRWSLESCDVVALHGCPVTSVERTLQDLPRVISREAAVCAADAALHRHLVAAEQLRPDLRRLADGRAESPLETLTRLLLLPVLPALVPQLPVSDERGRPVARLDLGDELRRLAVEADGRTWHGTWEARRHDADREERLRRLGWTIVRVTWDDVRRRPAFTVQRVLAAAERCRPAA